MWAHFRRLFQALFVVVVVAIVVGSLAPQVDGVPASLNDKVMHLTAYTVAGLVAVVAFASTRMRLTVLLVLVLLGISLEFAQSAVPGRTFDLLDMAANAVGTGIALLAIGLTPVVQRPVQPCRTK